MCLLYTWQVNKGYVWPPCAEGRLDAREMTTHDATNAGRVEELISRHTTLRDCLQSIYNGCAPLYAPGPTRSAKAEPPPGKSAGEMFIGVVTEVFREKEHIESSLWSTHGERVRQW